MIIRFDIDLTICKYEDEREYPKAVPIQERIDKINKLYDDGHTIVYWTARGSVTKIDWAELTVTQLNKWGAKYHKVELGKPHYDLYIDDKSINSELYFGGETE